jgi:hypothetical protein
LHSMQRSASQMNFILAMVLSLSFLTVLRSHGQARSMLQSVVLVSCIIVTES